MEVCKLATRRHLTPILRFAERYPFRKSGLPLTRQRCGHGGGGERPGKLRGCGRRRCRLLRRGEQKVRRERGAKSPIVGGRGSVRLGSSSWGATGGTHHQPFVRSFSLHDQTKMYVVKLLLTSTATLKSSSQGHFRQRI